MVYDLQLATPGNLTTNATPNTETDAIFVKAGVRNCAIKSLTVTGAGASLATITGIKFRGARFGTASTAGTALTPSPKDPGMQAAKATCASRPTLGTTRTGKMTFGCGATSQYTWVPLDPDSKVVLEGGGALSFDLFDICGAASQIYELGGEIEE